MRDDISHEVRYTAFLKWWSDKHDWAFTADDTYERRFQEAFNSGWDARKHQQYIQGGI